MFAAPAEINIYIGFPAASVVRAAFRDMVSECCDI